MSSPLPAAEAHVDQSAVARLSERFWAEGFGLPGMALTVRQNGWRCPVHHKLPHVLSLVPERLLILA
jgi:hypothetical protein